MLSRATRSLPVPHLFMVLSLSVFVVLILTVQSPGSAAGTAAADPGASTTSFDHRAAPRAAADPAAGPAAGRAAGPVATDAGPTTEVLLAMDVEVLGAPLPPPAAAIPGSGGHLLVLGLLAALTGLLAVTFQAGRQHGETGGRPGIGLLAGSLAGLVGATLLFLLGAIPAGNPTWVYLPLVLATLGTAMGVTAPFPPADPQGRHRSLCSRSA